MPVLAVNFTITAQRIKTKENTFVECYHARQFESKGIFFRKTKTTLSNNKPFLWCFVIIKISIRHSLCCEYIQRLCSHWVLKKLPVSYTAVCAGERLRPSYFSCITHRLCLLSVRCRGSDFVLGFSSPPSSVSLLASGTDSSFPNQLCRHDLRIGPYLVTTDRDDLLTIHGRLTRTPTPASKWHVHEAMFQVASPCIQSRSQHSWTNVVWMYTVIAERLLRIPEP